MHQGAPSAPTPFGKYLLDREIARGGMARVWLARLRGQGGFEKRLVVKQILPHLADDPRFVSLFVEEAKTLVQLSHPHIVPVYELGVVEGIWFLAMEHVEGATLAAILEGGALDPESVAHVGVQLAEALSYAHERFELVHRDVTPRNVIVESSGHARLLDFGIAARATPEGEAGSGAVYGTPGYVSPEQARGEAIDARSDLFSLGCVLFEALTGAPAFSRADLAQVRELTAADIPPLPSSLDDLATTVRRCLEPSPGERPGSAREVVRALRAWLNTRDSNDPGDALGARVGRARASIGSDAPSTGSDAPRTPGAARLADRSLATSRLLDEIVTPSPSGQRSSRTGADSRARPPVSGNEPSSSGAEPGTLRLDRPQSRGSAGRPPEGDASKTRPSGWRTVAATAISGTLAIYLVTRAGYDPPLDDPARSETDVDATMSLPPGDGDLDDAGTTLTPIGDTLDGGPPDAGIEPAAPILVDAGPRARAASATLRVTSDGNAAVELDGHPLGHAPIHDTVITAGAHTLVADCVALGRQGRASFRAAAGGSIRARVNCTADPVTVVVAGAE